MDLVLVEPGVEGLGSMLAELIAANLRTDPARERLVRGNPASVDLHVRDAEVEVGITFTGSAVRVGGAHGDADLTITCDAATLMEMTNVPLRFGMPDQMTPRGRAIAAKLINGQIRVTGLPRQLPLMIRLQRLFTVA